MARATGSINCWSIARPWRTKAVSIRYIRCSWNRMSLTGRRWKSVFAMLCDERFVLYLRIGLWRDETLYALADGNEVRVGDMFIVKPKLGMMKHKDKNGIEWKGPIMRVIQFSQWGGYLRLGNSARRFLERLKRHSNGCSRQYWSVKSTPKEADRVCWYCRDLSAAGFYHGEGYDSWIRCYPLLPRQ